MAPPFRFTLDPVLKFRREMEEAAERAFALARRTVLEQEMLIARYLVEEAQGKSDLGVLQREQVDLPALQVMSRYLSAMNRRIARAQSERDGLAATAEARRQELIKATQARKVLEKLRERRRREYDRMTNREEQKRLDELSSARFAREAAEALDAATAQAPAFRSAEEA